MCVVGAYWFSRCIHRSVGRSVGRSITGLDAAGTYKVRDLWARKDLGNLAASVTLKAVAPHASGMVLVSNAK